MRKEYDFSASLPNPYAERLTREVSFRLDDETLGFFQAIGDEAGLSAERIMWLYLRQIAAEGRKVEFDLPGAGDRQKDI